MSSVGLAVNVNTAVAHARMQSRFTSYGWALMLSNKGFILGVGPSRGRTPQLTNAGDTHKFIGAAFDDYLRAFDVESGVELWRGRVPAGPQATPMTYLHDGRQYVVIAAGGYGRGGTTLGDAIVAFALPAE